MDAFVSAGNGPYTVIAIGGEIDLANSDSLLRRLIVLTHPATGQVVLDLSRVTFIDCCGLEALVGIARHLRARGGSLHMAALSPAVARLLELARPIADLPAIPAHRASSHPRSRRRGPAFRRLPARRAGAVRLGVTWRVRPRG